MEFRTDIIGTYQYSQNPKQSKVGRILRIPFRISIISKLPFYIPIYSDKENPHCYHTDN